MTPIRIKGAACSVRKDSRSGEYYIEWGLFCSSFPIPKPISEARFKWLVGEKDLTSQDWAEWDHFADSFPPQLRSTLRVTGVEKFSREESAKAILAALDRAIMFNQTQDFPEEIALYLQGASVCPDIGNVTIGTESGLNSTIGLSEETYVGLRENQSIEMGMSSHGTYWQTGSRILDEALADKKIETLWRVMSSFTDADDTTLIAAANLLVAQSALIDLHGED